MSPRKTEELKRSLKKKGFQQQDTHHEMYWLYVNGKKTSIKTRISHGAQEYSDNLLSQMAKQVGLGKNEFDNLIDCPLSEEKYVQLLQEKGKVKL